MKNGNSVNETKSGLLQVRIEPELKKALGAACSKRSPRFKEADIVRFLVIHFVKNPDMIFEI